MAEKNCPVCFSELIVKEVRPCMDCGGDEFEQDHFLNHEYNEYEICFKQRLVLCNFCDVDFGSYVPEYLGFPSGKRIGYEHFIFIKNVEDKQLRPDNFCPECHKRLPFLKFIIACREENLKL
jgi:hypothetical protein